MKIINVDEAVFAAIWRHFAEGDEGENTILRRILGIDQFSESHLQPAVPGYTDPRSGMVFPRGFEIFRTRKRVKYRAVAMDGVWRLEDGRTAASLNKLSDLVDAKTESAWEGWYCNDQGQRKLIREIRDRFVNSKPKHQNKGE